MRYRARLVCTWYDSPKDPVPHMLKRAGVRGQWAPDLPFYYWPSGPEGGEEQDAGPECGLATETTEAPGPLQRTRGRGIRDAHSTQADSTGWAGPGERGNRDPECQDLGHGPPQASTQEPGGRWKERVIFRAGGCTVWLTVQRLGGERGFWDPGSSWVFCGQSAGMGPFCPPWAGEGRQLDAEAPWWFLGGGATQGILNFWPLDRWGHP